MGKSYKEANLGLMLQENNLPHNYIAPKYNELPQDGGESSLLGSLQSEDGCPLERYFIKVIIFCYGLNLDGYPKFLLLHKFCDLISFNFFIYL